MDYKSEFWHRLSSNFSAQELAKFRRQFDELDISRDESIDAVELDALLRSFGHNPSPDEIQEMIQAIDLDKSGTIEFDEFLHMIWAIRSGQGGGKFAAFFEEISGLQANPSVAHAYTYTDDEVATCLAKPEHAWFKEAESMTKQSVTQGEMAPLEWTEEEFGTGVKKCDLQHQKLFRMINEMQRIIEEEGGDTVELGSMIDGLLDYCVYHFKTEEDLFATHGYDNERDHNIVHQAFTQKVKSVANDFKASVVGHIQLTLSDNKLAWNILRFLRVWLIEHIQAEDRRYGEPLNAAGVH
ncbi:MAG: bacteriohemerythrin [SAR324 cluster bacterium]|jgi:hemerythrin-like metal-binding protein|nr:bacteriohemerythrin [SAR324 cluster bacterium]|tara:strand:- start:1156 stop:2046 length:891 start_codon:yes stop_codon:yes gene_type:complete